MVSDLLEKPRTYGYGKYVGLLHPIADDMYGGVVCLENLPD
jgi:hypothetical protein